MVREGVDLAEKRLVLVGLAGDREAYQQGVAYHLGGTQRQSFLGGAVCSLDVACGFCFCHDLARCFFFLCFSPRLARSL